MLVPVTVTPTIPSSDIASLNFSVNPVDVVSLTAVVICVDTWVASVESLTRTWNSTSIPDDLRAAAVIFTICTYV